MPGTLPTGKQYSCVWWRSLWFFATRPDQKQFCEKKFLKYFVGYFRFHLWFCRNNQNRKIKSNFYEVIADYHSLHWYFYNLIDTYKKWFFSPDTCQNWNISDTDTLEKNQKLWNVNSRGSQNISQSIII